MPGTINPNQENLASSLNLARPSVVEKAPLPRGFYKSVALDVLTVLSALAVSYVYKLYLRDLASVWLMVGATAAFSIFSVFEMLLKRNLSRRVAVLVLETAALLVFFYLFPFKSLAMVGTIVFLLLLWGEMLSYRELDNALEIKFFKTAKPLLSKLTTAIIFFAIIFYLPQWSVEKSLIPREMFQKVFDFSSQLFKRLYPELDVDSSLRDFASSSAQLQLKDNLQFRTATPAQRETALQGVSAAILAGFRQAFGDAAKADDSLAEIFYNFITTTLKRWQSTFGNAFIVVWAVAVFFIVRGFGIIFRWVVSFLVFLVYHILLASGVIHLVGESRMHEVVEYS